MTALQGVRTVTFTYHNRHSNHGKKLHTCLTILKWSLVQRIMSKDIVLSDRKFE